MNSLGKAVVMAIVLFLYGYFLSTAGHDHASHQQSIKDSPVGEGNVSDDHRDHNHHH